MKRYHLLLLLLLPTLAHTQATRSALGVSGPAYWQNRANYDIRASLDTIHHRITGRVRIEYNNNSPYALPYLWLQLDQNKYQKDSRSALANTEARHDGSATKGFEIGAVTYNGQPAVYTITDTRLQLKPKLPLPANGGKAEIIIDYAFTIPEQGADRMGRIQLEDGWVYEIAQWYPRMAVLDDVNGWNTLPYLGPGEFYCEYGNYDYSIEVPKGFVVAGSGALLNPTEVLPRAHAKRLDQALKSDTSIYIVGPEEAGNAPVGGKGETAIWKFRMENTRDVAWACSKGFLWDASGLELSENKRILVQSFYPRESQEGWSRANEYAKASLKHYSDMWFAYPYPTLSNVAGVVGGMEYPGLHFTGYARSGNALWVTLDHEVAHNWFPMIVGSNERRHAWMDESFVTFMGYYAARAFEGADYQSYISNPPAMMRRFMDADLGPVMRPPRKINRSFSDVVYFKPAIALLLLREYVLGQERFDYAFRQYIQNWAYKHPRPEDFFNSMENGAGEELDWFWQGWFYEDEELDQEITSARMMGDSTVSVTLTNRLGMPMPVVVEYTFADGSTARQDLPVDIWNQNDVFSFRYEAEQPIQSIQIDPDGWLPDVERRNNRWMF